MGTGSHFYRGSGGNRDNYLEISIDYRGKNRGDLGNVDIFRSITAVEAVMGRKHCARGGNMMISCPHGMQFY